MEPLTQLFLVIMHPPQGSEVVVTVAIVAGAHETSPLCSAADFSSLVVFS